MTRCTLQDVFAEHAAGYARRHPLHPREARAAWCIANCYTPACGSHWLSCPNGHHFEQLHACGHRSCPRCGAAARQRWLQAQLQRLLPCPHFHVVFTWPHQLLPLWAYNRSRMAQLLFDAARSSLLALLADPRHLGATPGILMALHTWGRNLSHHPHVHALVTAGGLDAALAWRPTRAGFLLPLAPLRKLFAGKLLAAIADALRAHTLSLPAGTPAAAWSHLLGRLWRSHWNIQISPPYDHGRGVALYLARYVRGGPLPQRRSLRIDPHGVSFSYCDHRTHRPKTLHLAHDEFISRILWHAPPKGSHTVRHAGLYASAAVAHHGAARVALACHGALPAPVDPPPTPPPTSLVRACPLCHATLQPTPAQRRNQIPLPQSATPPADTAALGSTGRSSRRRPAGASRPPQPYHRAAAAGLRQPAVAA